MPKPTQKKPTAKKTAKTNTDTLISEISSLRESLELKQELTNLRVEVAQLRQELADMRGRSQGAKAKIRIPKIATSGSSPTQD